VLLITLKANCIIEQSPPPWCAEVVVPVGLEADRSAGERTSEEVGHLGEAVRRQVGLGTGDTADEGDLMG
jgi:hypothetical protein